MLTDHAALQQQVDALNQRAHQLRHHDARQALQLCRQAHVLALQAGYQRGLAWSLLRLGVCQLVLGLMRSRGDQAGEAEALNLLGNVWMDRHALHDALACHQRCLAQTEAAPARGLCDKLRQRVAGHDWAALRPGLGPITISIGLAALQPDDDVAALLARADRQRYRAKQAGRNRVWGGAV